MTFGNGELTNSCQTMHLTGILITEQCRCFSIAERQITIAMLFCFVYIILERTCHRTKCKYLFVCFFITQNKHAVFVMIPVSGDLVKVALGHKRCFCSYVTTFCLFILDPSLQFLHHDDTVWHDQRKSLSNYINCCENLHFTSKFVMVTFLCFFHLSQMLFQLIFCSISSSIDTCKHCILFTASPVSAGRRKQFKCFYTFYAHQMWPCTEVCPVSLRIEGNFGIFRKILDQFYFIWFIFFFKICNSIFSGFCETFDLCTFFDDLFHFFFDCIQVFT